MRSALNIMKRSLWSDVYSLQEERSTIANMVRSSLIGVTANGLFKYSITPSVGLTSGSAFNYGYGVLGPLLVGYVMWLQRSSVDKKLKTLYFLSREGLILKKIYDILSPIMKGDSPLSQYLLCSRRCVSVACLQNVDDVIEYAGRPYRKSGVVLGALFEYRFGIPLPTRFEVVKNYLLTSSHEDRVFWIKVCTDSSNEILSNAAKEREGYLKYLQEEGFDYSCGALVDIGWMGNLQGYLGKLLNTTLTGFYYALHEDVYFWLRQGHCYYAFLGANLPYDYESSVLANRLIIEHSICCEESSLVKFNIMSNQSQAVFREEDGKQLRGNFISQSHAGIIQFTESMVKFFGEKIN